MPGPLEVTRQRRGRRRAARATRPTSSCARSPRSGTGRSTASRSACTTTCRCSRAPAPRARPSSRASRRGSRSQDRPHGSDELIALAAPLEGHPDNVAAAIAGGFTRRARRRRARCCAASSRRPGSPSCSSCPITSSAPTESRKSLRPDVPRADAVYSLQRAALLVLALASGDLDALPRALDDRLHQPDRAGLTPMFCGIQEQLPELGAFGCTLSGAGPSTLLWVRAERAARRRGARRRRCCRDAVGAARSRPSRAACSSAREATEERAASRRSARPSAARRWRARRERRRDAAPSRRASRRTRAPAGANGSSSETSAASGETSRGTRPTSTIGVTSATPTSEAARRSRAAAPTTQPSAPKAAPAAASGTSSSGMRDHAAPDDEISAATPKPSASSSPSAQPTMRAERDLLADQHAGSRSAPQQAGEHVLVPLERQHGGAEQQRHERQRDAEAVALHLRAEQVRAAARRLLHEAHGCAVEASAWCARPSAAEAWPANAVIESSCGRAGLSAGSCASTALMRALVSPQPEHVVAAAERLGLAAAHEDVEEVAVGADVLASGSGC